MLYISTQRWITPGGLTGLGSSIRQILTLVNTGVLETNLLHRVNLNRNKK